MINVIEKKPVFISLSLVSLARTMALGPHTFRAGEISWPTHALRSVVVRMATAAISSPSTYSSSYVDDGEMFYISPTAAVSIRLRSGKQPSSQTFTDAAKEEDDPSWGVRVVLEQQTAKGASGKRPSLVILEPTASSSSPSLSSFIPRFLSKSTFKDQNSFKGSQASSFNESTGAER